jgi:hypothetical protein
MAKFEKGWAGGPGRPVGSKNKSYTSLNVWFELIHSTLEELPPEKKLEYGFKAAELLLAKVQTLPGTPGDSRSNADNALAELKAAEEYGIKRDDGSPPSQSGSDGADVAAGPAQG